MDCETFGFGASPNENWDSWQGASEEKEELHCEDPGFNMDCDYEPTSGSSRQLERPTHAKRGKRRRQSAFAAAVAREKPVFDPKATSFEKYVDEYYALDYEDLIGDLPCRFKYRKVVPNDFGLTVEEILAAPDRELNSWVSVKKIMQRRPENVELFDVQAYRKKARNPNKKQKHLPSLYGEGAGEGDSNEKGAQAFREKTSEKEMHNKKEKKSEKKKKLFGRNCNQFKFGPDKRIKSENENECCDKGEAHSARPYDISDIRLKSYGINPKKLRNKLKFGNKKALVNH